MLLQEKCGGDYGLRGRLGAWKMSVDFDWEKEQLG